MTTPNHKPQNSTEAETNKHHDERLQRRQQLKAWRNTGSAFPNTVQITAFTEDLHKQYTSLEADVLNEQKHPAKIAGRLITRRIMGKASFSHIQDMTGRLQLYLRKQDLQDAYQDFKNWSIGDLISAEGTLFKTKTGELSLHCQHIQLLSKALHPLPEKFHGLKDPEYCYRQRYLDLMTNEKTRKVFQTRSHILHKIRDFLTQKHFLEVETPMMQLIAGGAAARPFLTHHNTLDLPLYLRVSPELYLKRLVVGGFERVFEIGRNFRNEGISTRHNPEFTMLEFYQAYATYETGMTLIENMLAGLCQIVSGTDTVTYQDNTLSFTAPFRRMTLAEALMAHHAHLTQAGLKDINTLNQLATQFNISLPPDCSLGNAQLILFEKTVEKQLIQPTFITQYPTEVSPLARRNDQNPDLADRFELFIGGQEIANGFSELNDPEDQAERFKAQAAAKAQGDEEAMHYDADYITALEYGMPPTAGAGIGIDRLIMLFTNADSIREVILFPLMRPKLTQKESTEL